MHHCLPLLRIRVRNLETLGMLTPNAPSRLFLIDVITSTKNGMECNALICRAINDDDMTSRVNLDMALRL
jgi:hypothetical protein